LDLCLASGERLLGRRSSAREEQSRKQPGPMEETCSQPPSDCEAALLTAVAGRGRRGSPTPSGIATEAREVQ